jgi:hypothetical protein
MLGGGMMSTHIKHNHLDEAMEHIYRAQSNLQRFDKELRDVGNTFSIDLEIGGLLKFSDYFFDDLITDWIVQGRIKDTLNQVLSKKSKVDALMINLASSKHQAEQEFNSLHHKYVQIVESYR